MERLTATRLGGKREMKLRHLLLRLSCAGDETVVAAAVAVSPGRRRRDLLGLEPENRAEREKEMSRERE